MAFVEFKNVYKRYKMGEIIISASDGVTFEIEKGEFVVIVGESGAGKTTILNMLGGMDTCDEGEIIVDGNNIAAFNRRQLTSYRRFDIGFVFQFYNLVGDLTVQENIEVCEYLSDNPLPIEPLLKSLGLWDHRKKFPHQISGGQQQRCAIGRALVKNPGLLLCDEPTGALDYNTSKEILELMEQVNRDYACTIIIVTHNDAIKHMAHRILRLRDGQIIEDVRNERILPARELEW